RTERRPVTRPLTPRPQRRTRLRSARTDPSRAGSDRTCQEAPRPKHHHEVTARHGAAPLSTGRIPCRHLNSRGFGGGDAALCWGACAPGSRLWRRSRVALSSGPVKPEVIAASPFGRPRTDDAWLQRWLPLLREHTG